MSAYVFGGEPEGHLDGEIDRVQREAERGWAAQLEEARERVAQLEQENHDLLAEREAMEERAHALERDLRLARAEATDAACRATALAEALAAAEAHIDAYRRYRFMECPDAGEHEAVEARIAIRDTEQALAAAKARLTATGGSMTPRPTPEQTKAVVALLALVEAQERVIAALIGPDDVIPDEAVRLRAALAAMAVARKRAGLDEAPR